MEELTIGQFIISKRTERNISLRAFAKKIDISPVYLCNIEKGRRPLTSTEILDKITNVFLLDKAEKTLLLDLAAKSKDIPIVASDLPAYINENDIVRVALRTAKDIDATDEEWQEFIDKLESRKRKTNGG